MSALTGCTIMALFRKMNVSGRQAWPGLILVLLIGALPGPVFSGDKAPVSLSKAVDIALENNLGLKQSSNSLDVQKLAVFQSKDSFLPNISGSIGTSLNVGREFDTVALRYTGTASGSFQLGMGLSMTLFNGLSRQVNLKAAKLTLKAGKEQYAREEQTVVYSTITAYVQVVIDQELIRVNQENVGAQEQELELIVAFHDAGKKSVADLFQQEALLAEAKSGLLSAESALVVDKLELIKTMGLKMKPGIEIEPLEAPSLDEGWGEEDVDDAVQEALAARADVQAKKTQIASSAKKVDGARSGYWPTISLMASGGTGYSSAMQEHFGFGEQFLDNKPNLSVGLSINIPIFDGLATWHKVQGAKLEVQAGVLELETLAQSIELEVRQSFENYRTTEEQLVVAEKKLKSAIQSLEAYEELYTAGGCTLVELAQARATHLEASVNEIKTKYDLLIKAAAIAYAKGDGEELQAMVKK
jgi:outer membrane protein